MRWVGEGLAFVAFLLLIAHAMGIRIQQYVNSWHGMLMGGKEVT